MGTPQYGCGSPCVFSPAAAKPNQPCSGEKRHLRRGPNSLLRMPAVGRASRERRPNGSGPTTFRCLTSASYPLGEVRPAGGERAGEQVAHAAEGHERVAGGAGEDVGAVRRGDEGVGAFEDDDGLVALDDAADGGGAVGLDLVGRAGEEAGGLAGVGREHEGLSLGLRLCARARGVPFGEDAEGVRVEHEASGTAGEDARDEHLAVLGDAEAHAHGGHVRARGHAGGRLLHEGGLGHEEAGGDARGVRHHELDESGARRARAESGEDGGVDVARGTADNGNRTGRIFVQIGRAFRECGCQRGWKRCFHVAAIIPQLARLVGAVLKKT